jgi:murein tripeptide amidase MpaA
MKHPARLLALLFSVVVVTALVGPAGAGDNASSKDNGKLQMYTLTADSAQVAELTTAGYEIIQTEDNGDGSLLLVLVLSPHDRNALRHQGYELEVWRNADGFTETQLAAQQAASGYNVWRSYDEPGGIRDEMYKIAKDNPQLVKLEVIGHTHQGREIIALKVTQGARGQADGRRPAVLYSSLQHAREWISVEVNRRLLHWYIDRWRANDKDIKNLLKDTELWFILVANPDGYQYTFEHDRLWRKNLRDNDGDGAITNMDGVDLNRNFPNHWNYDDEGSSSQLSSETYRGPTPASEPETQAMVGLMNRIPFAFQVNYHSFGELLLYSFGWQVQTPSADDPIFVALSGTDANPAIPGYDPGVGADLYTTNGETTDEAHAGHGILAWTPELGEGDPAGGFVFPDDPAQVQAEFERNRPFALDVARSATDPDDPKSHLGNTTEPFYLDMETEDPWKHHNPITDLSFPFSYGDPQPVRVLAKRALGAVTAHWQVNGAGPVHSSPTQEWAGGERFGDSGDVYYRHMEGTVTGTSPGDSVKVWFTGGGQTSPSFTYEAVQESNADLLILAAEDYKGTLPNQPPNGPHYLDYYVDALPPGTDYDVYDVDAMEADGKRQAPDNLGVLSHYDATIWYTGDDIYPREPGQPGGTGASTLANDEALEVRSFLNEGGKLLFTGQDAGSAYIDAVDYNPLGTPPYCDNVDQTVDDGCLIMSDDFLQYYLGAYIANSDAGTDPDGNPYPVDGTATPYLGSSWEFNGPDSAQNQAHTYSFITTSSLLKPEVYPQFLSDQAAEWRTGVSGPFEPHGGDYYVYSDRADVSYKRLTRTIDLTGVTAADAPSLSFFTSYDTEPAWDFHFVEAHTVGQDDWTTLPDENGHTSPDVGDSCDEGWHELHPWLERYQGADCSGANPDTGGTWNASSGRSDGWEEWEVDLSSYAGDEVEISISYASDWAVQGLGVWLDDFTVSTGEGSTGFETADMGGWAVPGPPEGSASNPNDFRRTTSVGFEEAAVVSTPDTLYFGFGFEGISTLADRKDVMARALAYLMP